MAGGPAVARITSFMVIFFFLNAMEATSILSRVIYGEWDGKAGDKISTGLNLLMVVVSLSLFFLGRKNLRRFRGGLYLALMTLALLAMSALWSHFPAYTVKRTLIYGTVTLGVAGIAGAMSCRDIIRLLLIACGLAAFASLAAYFAMPAMARMAVTDEMRGVFPHKNVIGPAMALGALAAIHLIAERRSGRAVCVILLILFIVCAVLSRSATSLITIAAFAVASALAALLRSPRFRSLGLMLMAVAIPITIAAFAAKDTVLEFLGKDPTLTGRTVLWAMVEDNIALKPLLGWGYSAFWDTENPAAQTISLSLGWFVPQAHNGVLELLLELGCVGTALFSFLWCRNLYVAWRCLATRAQPVAVTALLFYVSLLLMGVSEAILLEPLQLSTALFFLFGFICERENALSRRAMRAPGRVTHQARLLSREA